MIEQGPSDREMNPDTTERPTELTPEEASKQAEAILKRLEKVLGEGAPQRSEESAPSTEAQDDPALYKEVTDGLNNGANIQVIPGNTTEDEVFTDDFVREAKEALSRTIDGLQIDNDDNES